MADNKTKPDRKIKKPKVSIIFKSIAGIAILLMIFSLNVSIIGFNSFTEALMEQYYEGAVLTAETAVMQLNGSASIEEYAQSGGTTEE